MIRCLWDIQVHTWLFVGGMVSLVSKKKGLSLHEWTIRTSMDCDSDRYRTGELQNQESYDFHASCSSLGCSSREMLGWWHSKAVNLLQQCTSHGFLTFFFLFWEGHGTVRASCLPLLWPESGIVLPHWLWLEPPAPREALRGQTGATKFHTNAQCVVTDEMTIELWDSKSNVTHQDSQHLTMKCSRRWLGVAHMATWPQFAGDSPTGACVCVSVCCQWVKQARERESQGERPTAILSKHLFNVFSPLKECNWGRSEQSGCKVADIKFFGCKKVVNTYDWRRPMRWLHQDWPCALEEPVTLLTSRRQMLLAKVNGTEKEPGSMALIDMIPILGFKRSELLLEGEEALGRSIVSHGAFLWGRPGSERVELGLACGPGRTPNTILLKFDHPDNGFAVHEVNHFYLKEEFPNKQHFMEYTKLLQRVDPRACADFMKEVTERVRSLRAATVGPWKARTKTNTSIRVKFSKGKGVCALAWESPFDSVNVPMQVQHGSTMFNIFLRYWKICW